ncbi:MULTISPECIES: TonB-dependent receptor [Asaia]|uniref:TonB-dependent receptor n=1 Tax=Asaia TaxID=91914 RepID=UPI00255577B3|nr:MULTISPECIES: TonB-dependent receptor [Asaia]MDL2172540.1 TonB-dependent receptor plug domain-containing protein [Asaia sp. HumB]
MAATMLASATCVASAQSTPQHRPFPKPAHSAPTKPPGAPKRHAGVAAEAAQEEAISVTSSRRALNGGGGMMRHETASHSIQTVTRQYIDMQSPASTALDMVKNLPSVVVSTVDSSGILGGQINSRSLTDSDMGILLDGVPVATAYYLNQNVDTENLAAISVTPGSAAIDLPVTSAAAGIMNSETFQPSDKFGGLMDFSYGTNNLSREFLRVESGAIGHSGIRTYTSFSHTHARTWDGPGTNERRHLDVGATKDFQDGSFVNLFVSWNHQFTMAPLNPTAQQFFDKKSRVRTFNYSSSYDQANPSDYGMLNGNMWDQVFVTLPLHVQLPSRFSLDFKPYYVYNGGYTYNGSLFNGSATPATVGPNGNAISGNLPAASYYSVYRPHAGAVAKLNYDIDVHDRLTFGYWFDYQDNQVDNRYSALSSTGKQPFPYASSAGIYVSGSRYMPYKGDSGWKIHSLFIEDDTKLLNDKLRINAGFKIAMINRWSGNYASTAPRIQSNQVVPLPQAAISYNIDSHNMVYVNAEGDFRMPDPGSLGQVFDAQTGTYVGNPYNAKPQYSIKEELGWRFNNQYLMADLELFNYAITNRLLSTNVYLNNQSISSTINAGNQTARGVDFMISGHPYHHVSPFVSVEYLNATTDSNIATTGTLNGKTVGDLLPTKGNTAVQSPHVHASAGLTYDNGTFFANGSVSYVSSQYSTFMNDQKMPGYVTDNLAIGYRFKSFGAMKTPKFQLNFSNLGGSFIRTGVSGLVANAQTTKGIYGSTVSASGSPTYYLYPRFSITGNISVGF